MCFHVKQDPIKLGFNDDLEDRCDYIDYSELNTNNRPDRTELIVLQLNIRGILNKQCKLQRLMTEIKGKHHLNIVLLEESWLKKSTEK